MKDSKQRTRHKILGELESIKSLLDDQLDDQPEEGGERKNSDETTATEPDDAPLLTEALNSAIGHIETSSESSDGASDLSVDDIPVLQATVEEDEWQDYVRDGEGDEDDIVTRALSNKRREATPSLFDSQGLSATDEPESSAAARPAEQQPSLFTGDHEPGPVSTSPATPSRSGPDHKQGTESGADAQKAERPATVSDQALRKPSDATENPFLPKHIRDRLLASRAIQQNAQVQSTRPPETTSSDDTFVDEMVRRYLPKIETELREKIRAMIRDEREAAEKSP